MNIKFIFNTLAFVVVTNLFLKINNTRSLELLRYTLSIENNTYKIKTNFKKGIYLFVLDIS